MNRSQSEPAELEGFPDEPGGDLARLAELLRANRPVASASFRARLIGELGAKAGPESSPFFNFGAPSW